jgi:hypothetical protein
VDAIKHAVYEEDDELRSHNREKAKKNYTSNPATGPNN